MQSCSRSDTDRGYAWVVVLGSFLVHNLVLGLQYSFGIFFVEIVNEFNANEGSAAWVPALAMAFMMGTSPLSGVLVRAYGTRPVALLGAAVIGLGMSLASLSSQLWHVTLAYGVLTGMGFSLAYVPSIVVLAHFWEKRRSLATGIAVAGSGSGTLVMAAITDALLMRYSWKQVMLIEGLGGMCLVALCACSYAPHAKLQVPAHTVGELPESKITSANTTMADSPVCTIVQGQTPVVEDDDGAVVGSSELASSAVAGSSELAGSAVVVIDQQADVNQLELQVSYVSPDSVLLTQGSAASKVSCSSLGSDAASPSAESPPPTHAPAPMPGKEADDTEGGVVAVHPPLWETLRRLWGIRKFRCLVFALGPNALGYLTPFTHLKAYAISPVLQLSGSDASLVLSAIGLASVAGRVVMGRVADMRVAGREPHIVRNWLFLGSAFGAALSVGGMGGATSLLGLVLAAVFFGVFSGAILSIMPVITADAVGVADLPVALPIMYFVQVPGFVVGAPIAGWVKVAADSYRPAFALSGGLMVLGASALLPLAWDNSPRADAAPVLAACKVVAGAAPAADPPGAAEGGGADSPAVPV